MKELLAPEEYCTIREAAARLGVSAPTVWRWVHAGHLPAERVGPRSIRIRKADLGRVVAPTPASPDNSRVQRKKRADELIARLRRLHEQQVAKYGVFESSVPIIRESREEWGKDN